MKNTREDMLQVIDVPIGACFITVDGLICHRILAPHDNGKALFDSSGRLLVCSINNLSTAYYFLLGDTVVFKGY